MARTFTCSPAPPGRSTTARTSARTGVWRSSPTRNSTGSALLGLIVRLRAELTVLAILLTARFWAWPRLDELARPHHGTDRRRPCSC